MSVVSDDGTAVQSCCYSAFGEPEICENGLHNEILYTGAVYDESTGFYYLSTRFYDSGNGRFTTMDSVRGDANNPLSLNIYAYCVNNPLKYTDEEGDTPAIIAGAIIGATMGAIFEVVDQYIAGRKPSEMNWKAVAVRAVGGGISGAFSATGVGLLGSTIFDMNLGTVENLVAAATEPGPMSNTEVLESLEYGVIDAAGGAGLQKVAGVAGTKVAKVAKDKLPKWKNAVKTKATSLNLSGGISKAKSKITNALNKVSSKYSSKKESAKTYLKRTARKAKTKITQIRKKAKSTKNKIKNLLKNSKSVLQAYAGKKASVTAHRFHKEVVKKQPQKVTGFRRVVKFFF